MKNFEVVLTKSYIVNIKAKNSDKAKEHAEFFTGDIQDISNKDERQKHDFSIENIECKLNEAYEAIEIKKHYE